MAGKGKPWRVLRGSRVSICAMRWGTLASFAACFVCCDAVWTSLLHVKAGSAGTQDPKAAANERAERMIYEGIKKRISLWLRASVMLHQWYLQTLTLGRGCWPWRHYVLIIGKSAAANKALAEMAALLLPMMLHRRALVVPSGIYFTPAPSFTSQHDSNNPPKSFYALMN